MTALPSRGRMDRQTENSNDMFSVCIISISFSFVKRERSDFVTDEARAAQRAYLAAWRKKNPEKVREQHRRYWERKAQQMRKNGGDTVAAEEN